MSILALGHCRIPHCALHTLPGKPYCLGHTPGGSFRLTSPRTPVGAWVTPEKNGRS